MNRKIDRYKKSSEGKVFHSFKAICVEEHDDLRNILHLRLKDIGTSYRGFRVDFSILKYNSDIQTELIKNGETDLVILDLDQTFDVINTVSQIRSFGLYTPIIFASVEKMKASKSLHIVSVNDLAFAQKVVDIKYEPYLLALKRIDDYLLSFSNKGEIRSLNQILFPIINNLIYFPMDKQSLYLSKGPRIISNAIFRAKEIKRRVEMILQEKRE